MLLGILYGVALATSILAVTTVVTPRVSTEKLNSLGQEAQMEKSNENSNSITMSSDVVKETNSDSIHNATTAFQNDFNALTKSSNNAQVSSGNTFGVVLKKDGTVWTWGNNTYGQLGNGNIENVNTSEPSKVLGVDGKGYLENIKQISVGAYTVSALTSDGKVVNWGRGEYGGLANGLAKNSAIPVYAKKQIDIEDEEGNLTTELVDLDNIIAISQGSSHVLALASDGTVWSWGLNNYGQLGINTASTTASNANYKRIFAVKVQHRVEVVDEQGNIETDENGNALTQLVDLDNIKQISGGTDYSLALTNNGEVLSWGLNNYGQLGNKGTTNSSLPTQVAEVGGQGYLSDIKQIDAGGLQALALKTDGTVCSWGMNRYGNLGINAASTSTTNGNYKKTTPVKVLKAASTPLTNVVDISSIYETSFALTDTNEVYGWGLNTAGQIGDYTVTNRTVATHVKTNAVTTLDGIKKLTEGQHTNVNYMIDEKGYLYGSGVSSNFQMMSDRTANTFFAVKLDETYLQLSNNQEYLEIGKTVNLTQTYYNGFNLEDYEISVGNIIYRSANEDIATVDNTGKVTAKSRGQVTIIAQDTTNGYIAQSIINVVSKDALALPMVVSGTTFTAYLKEDGTVWTSGDSTSGELGNGSNIKTNMPTQVKINTNEYLTDIRKIAVGTQHAIALRKDGTVWSWGLNSSGQLGIGSTDISRYAVQVENPDGSGYLEDVIDIDTGVDNSSALTRDGKAYAWGNATNNGLGVNSTSNKTRPCVVHGVNNCIQVQSGSNNIIVLKGDGTVWGAGQNNVGQLGDTTTVTPKAEVIQTVNNTKDGPLTGVMRIASGDHHTVALKEDKTAWIWGHNNVGEQGINSTTHQYFPIPLRGVANTGVMENIVDISTGPQATYIKTMGGNIYAVGLNTTGQLSIGNSTNIKAFTAAKDEDGNPLTGVATINKSMGTSFGFAFEDGTVGITGLGTSGQHGNLTWANSNKITKIDDASLNLGNIYEVQVNGTAKINVEVKQEFNLNINNKTQIKAENLIYESLDEQIAQVSQDGTITGIKKGNTGIRVTDETNGLEATAQVIVGDRDLSDIYKIVTGDSHTVLLKNDGTVWSWGDNTYGQLGNGTIGGKETVEPIQVLGVNGKGYLTDIVDIAVGTQFSVALKKNGEVLAWGINTYGQIGAPNDIAQNPIYVKDYNGNILTGVIEISASRDHAVALKADGSVWTWGRNDYYQLGNNSNVNSSYAVQVLANSGGEYLTGVKQVSCGGAYVVALKQDGTVWSWGLNTNAQTGNATITSPQKFPVQAKDNTGAFITDVKKISTGHHYTLALKGDGTVWSWGLNDYAQLGIGVSSTSSSNANYRRTSANQVKIDASTYLTDVIDIGTTLRTAYALTSNGTLYSWGRNNEGGLGQNISPSDTSVSKFATKVVRIYGSELENKIVKLMGESANGVTGYAVREDGSIIGFGRIKNGQILDGGLYSSTRNYADDVLSSYLEITERNSYIKIGETKKLNVRTVENLNVFGKAPEHGKLTWKSTNENIVTVDENGNIQAKEIGNATIIVTEDLHGYRAQATIYVTNNSNTSITTPMVVQGTSFTGVLKADGSVWTTGLNTLGQLGDGTTNFRAELEQVKIDEDTYLTNVLKIASGTSHMLALTNTGKVYAWGLGTSGQLGNGETANSLYAAQVLDQTGEDYLDNIIDIVAGGAHSLALDSHGNVYAWGKGANYQLGNYATANKTLPVRITDAYNIVKMSAGTEYTILLRGDGVALGTGINTNGWLGMGDTSTRNTPLEVGSLAEQSIMKNIYDIATGGNHTIFLKEDGKAYATGTGTSGQLSQNSTGNLNIPDTIKILKETESQDGETQQILEDLQDIVNISAGNSTTFIMTKDGKTYCSGLNTSGQLGLGDTSSPITTVHEVLDITGENTLKDVLTFAKGCNNTLNSAFILKNGQLLTVGTGANGQLGNGEYLNSYLPTIAGNYDIRAKEQHIKLKIEDTKQIELDMIQGFNVFNIEKDVEQNIKYESLNTKVAIVSEKGLITGKRIGTTKIKITDETNGLEEYVLVNVLHSLGKAEAKVANGINFTVSLKEDGTVWSWGTGTSGRLGTGNTNNQTEPVQVLSPDGKNKLKDVIDIAVGYDSASALLSDGTIVSWGNNGSYNLGDNTNTDKSLPTFVLDEQGNKLRDIVKISRGNDFCLALTSDGEIYSWGWNKYGQLGNNNSDTKSVPAKVKDETGKGILTNIIDIGCGMRTSYALTEDGKIWAWGYNDDGQFGNGIDSGANVNALPKKANIDNVAKLVPSAFSLIALKEDGSIWSWGWNSYGQIGNGSTTNALSPVQPKLNSETLVIDEIEVYDIGTAGGTHYILDSQNKIYAVGQNGLGQVGDNTTTNRTYYVEVKGKYGENLSDKFVKLSSSIARTDNVTDTGNAYFIREDGSLFGVGKNTTYQLLGKMTDNLKSAKPLNISYMEITDRINYIKIGETKKLTTDVVENFNMYARKPVTGEVTWSSSNAEIASVDKMGNITALKEGETTITAVDSKYGYVATAKIYVTRNSENVITIPQVEQGLDFTVVLKADGTVWATGKNDVGQCGTATSDSTISNLTQVKLPNLAPLTNVVKISTGLSHTIALTKDGKVYGWGLNSYGQLGTNDKINSNCAVEMLNSLGTEAVENIIDIEAGRWFSTILTENGNVYGVGSNACGQLGDATNTNRLIPTKIEEMHNVVQVVAGQYYTAMLRGDETVWVVGQNYYGQLGINTTTRGGKDATNGVNLVRQTMNSTKNGVLKDITQLSAGGWHIVALNKEKEVYTWGFGTSGQIGNNTVNESITVPQNLYDPTDLIEIQEGEETPKQEVIGKVAKVGTSERVTFVITNDNKVYATGENSNYQLSQNHNTDVKVITKLYDADGENYIDNIINVISSSSNTNNTALIKSDGSVWVTGLGAFGQIGNNKYLTVTNYTRMGTANLEIDKIMTLPKGNTKKLEVTLTSGFNVYTDAAEKKPELKYTSLCPEIATVDENGLVTAVAEGTTKVIIDDEINLLTTFVEINVTRDEEDKVKAKIQSGGAAVLLKTDGTVWTFGNNTYGTRGVGDTDYHEEETQVLDTNGVDKLTNIIDVSAGSYFMVAVKEDGRVVTWGRSNVGQLGNGQNVNSSIPVYVIDANGKELTDVIKVSCGTEYALALKKDGTVWSWGYNNYGQLGNNSGANSNVAVQVKDTTGKGYIRDICDISCQAHTSIALTSLGEVYSWGYNYHGQIGNGTRNTGTNPTGRRVLLPVKSSITDVVKVVGGYHHTLALKSDGSVWAWGLNRYGTLGYGKRSESSSSGDYLKATPIRVKLNSTDNLTDVIDIGTSYETSFAKTADGTVYGWGRNERGSIGVNNTTHYAYPQTLKKMYGETLTDNIVTLNRSAAVSTTYFIRDDGTVLGNGISDVARLVSARTADVLSVTELRPDFLEIDSRASHLKLGQQIKLNARVNNRLNAFTGIKIKELEWSSSNLDVATVSNDGTVTTVGLGEVTITVKDKTHGYQGQSIIYVIQDNEKAIAVPDISQGVDFTAVLKSDGSVWTTGLNNNGQLGDGTITNRTKPVRVKVNNKEYLTNIVKISAGTDHCIALSKTGEVYAWGLNDAGQLGNGTTTRNVYANKVLDSRGNTNLNKVIDISSGHKFSIVLLENGDVYGFGRNAYGELGTLNNANRILATKMDGIANAVKVQANSNSSSIQIGNGTVWTTGYNNYGTLGQNASNTGSSAATQGRTAANPVVNPTRNGILKNIVKTVTGLHQTIVLTEDNKVYVWGYNNYGQLGTGNTTNFSYPTNMRKLGDVSELQDKVIDIGASGYRTLVKTIDKQEEEHLLITGYNNYGQLGNNSTSNSTSLIPVNNEDNTEEKKTLDILPDDSRATNNTGYIDETGNVWTVGLNTYGAIGDDTLYQRKNIVQIGEISLIPEEIIFTMNPNDTKQIKVREEDSFNVYIYDIEIGKLEYESLNNDIAKVNNDGTVTAVGIGSTLIKVTDKEKDIQTAVYVKVIKDQEDMKYEPMVDGGSNHSVALKGNGTVWTWGYNKFGQLGNNGTATTEEPVQVLGKDAQGFLSDIQMIASGTNHILALNNDGTVWSWGYNNYGQLGDNTQINKYTPVQVISEDGEGYLQDIIYIGAGANFSVAVNKYGEVYSWGQNDYGQLGDGSKTARYTPVRAKANLTGIIQVACGARHTVALKTDGSVYTWGDNTNGQLGDNSKVQRLIPVKVLETANDYVSDAVEVSATNYTTNILKSDGTVISVGLGTSGQLGDGTSTTKQLPTKVVNTDNTGNLSNIITIKSGANTTYALTKGGNVYAWGIGTNGQLGNHGLSNSNKPVLVSNSVGEENIKDILYIGAGANHALAVENTGYVEVWGLNDQKQIGDSTVQNSSLPIYIGSKVVATPNTVTLNIGDTQEIKVALESFNLFKAEQDLSRKITFKSLNENVVTVNDAGILTGKSMGITRVVATDSVSRKVATINVTVLENGGIATPKIASGINHTIALKSDGTVWAWGLNNHGQLGTGTTANSYVPVKVDIENVIDIAAGDHFSIALKSDGTVWVWGYNDRGQLAQGNTSQVLSPIQAKGVGGIGFLDNVKKIAACRYSWIALLNTTEVVGCGANTQALLGDNTTTDRHTPVYMVNYNGVGHLTNVRDISIGQCESTILKEDGTLWAVGHNCAGGLGIGSTKAYSRIKQVKDTTGTGVLTNIIQVSSGGWYSLALDAQGNVYSWGQNRYGQLGINSTTNKTLPQKVLGVNGTGYLQNIVSINAGYYTSLAIDAEGNVYSWGYNVNGQLGVNNLTTYKVPKQVLNEKGNDILKDVMISNSNGYHSTFVKYDGTVWTVGYNAHGELGNDSNVSTKLVGCISYPKLEVNEKYIAFGKIGESKEVELNVNPGFNLLTNTMEGGQLTYSSLDESVATVEAIINTSEENSDTSKRGKAKITAKGLGTRYIRVTNEKLGLTTTIKVVVPAREGVTWPKISGGLNHYVALKADGTVWTWGLNNVGQLGLGNTSNMKEPKYTEQKDVIDIAAGGNFTAILKKDGTVWVTGQNNYGQLGQNTTTNSTSFIQVKSQNGLGYLTDIIAISANNYYMAALKKDGTVYTWGYNAYGQLGDNSTSTRKLPVRVRKVNNIMDIAAGTNHLVLIDSDGTVWATGLNTNGQLGINSTTNSTIPVKVLKDTKGTQISNILKVSAGVNYTVLLSEDGKIYSTGYNKYGQLATGNTTRTLIPVQAKDKNGEIITNAKDIYARDYIVSMVRKDGSVWTVGYNPYGAAGNNTTTTNKVYTKVLGEYGNGEFANAILSSNTSNTTIVADNVGRVYTTGYNAYGQLGDKTTTNTKTLVGISHTSLEVKEPIIVLHSIGETKRIEAKMNLGFNILFNTLENETYKYKSLNPNIITVDEAGVITSVKYGTARVQVTNIETGESAIVIVNVVRQGCIANPKVESGVNFTIGLKADGSVWTWGYNGYGQLGVGDTKVRLEPTKIDIQDVVDISCGNNHVLLLKQDGTVWAMGLNNYGQIGNNTTKNVTTPVQVSNLTNIIGIDGGANHSIALKSDGSVWTWGYNAYGGLGDSTTTRRSIPVQVNRLQGIKEVAAGNHSSFALDIEGNVYAWGLNTSGQLGNAAKANLLIPTKLQTIDKKILTMDVGINYTVLVTEDGNVYSFGVNSNGRLGTGNTTNKNVPTQVKLQGGKVLDNIEAVSTGSTMLLLKLMMEKHMHGD